ncbi:carbohydrate kinase family protein [Kutzneria sp. NPDC052558]|uniref:carbohydrate kinase family protein n=1 Tax=Kutzneria sp. NPDC052558 TaxID=3364121 RepID=UPI0037C8FF0C
MSTVAVAGIVNLRVALPVDTFPVPYLSSRRLPGRISLRLSGVGWTAASTLRTLGSEVVFATYLGHDLAGLTAAAGLREQGLLGPATLYTEHLPRAVVLYDTTGRRAGSTDLRDTTTASYPPEVFSAALDQAGRCDLALLTNINFTRPLIPVAVDRGIPIATDLHLVTDVDSAHNQDWMRVAHILACSHERLPLPPTNWIRAIWRRYGTPLVLVGAGERGALLGVRETGTIWSVEATTPRGVHYTSGAGDTLLATFTHYYARTGDPVAAVRHACLAAGWKIGGQPDEPIAITPQVLASLVLPDVSPL